MKYLLIISILLYGCNPFANKELRKKDKCNRKFDQLILKCPDLKTTDSVLVPFEVIVPKIEIKDSVWTKIDTLELLKYITKDKIKYVVNSISIDTLVLDSLYKLKISLSNGVLSYNIEIYQRTIKDTVKAPINVIKPIDISYFDKCLLWLNNKWKWLIFLILPIILIIYIFLHRLR